MTVGIISRNQLIIFKRAFVIQAFYPKAAASHDDITGIATIYRICIILIIDFLPRTIVIVILPILLLLCPLTVVIIGIRLILAISVITIAVLINRLRSSCLITAVSGYSPAIRTKAIAYGIHDCIVMLRCQRKRHRCHFRRKCISIVVCSGNVAALNISRSFFDNFGCNISGTGSGY